MVQVKHLSSNEEHMEIIYREFLSIYSKGNVFKDDVLKQMKINRYSPENDYIEDKLKKDNISNKIYDGGIIDVKATPVKLSGSVQQNKSGTYKVVRANQSYGSFKNRSDAEFILEKLIENNWDRNIIPKLCEEHNIKQSKSGGKGHRQSKPLIRKTPKGKFNVRYKNKSYGTYPTKSKAKKILEEVEAHKDDFEYLETLRIKSGRVIPKRDDNGELVKLSESRHEGFSIESVKMFNNSLDTLNRIIRERNCSSSTRKGYESSYMMFCKFIGPKGCTSLDELVKEYLTEEDEGIPIRDRKIKKNLLEYREFLVNDSENTTRTIKTYFSKIKTILRHLNVQIPELPTMKMERGYISGYGDLPTHAMIRTACDQVDIELTSIILYMSSSGNAKAETLSITVGMFLRGCEEYLETPPSDDNIKDILDELKDRHDIIPTIYLKRIKTDKWFYTCCSPEATYSIFQYLLTRRDTLSMDSPLWDISSSLLLTRFQELNDNNKWGWVGSYRRFRSHALRKFHASNLGLSRDIIDQLQGRSKDEIQEAYFKQDPKQLKKMYTKYMKNILIYDNFGWGGTPEDIERIKENKRKAQVSDTDDGIVDLTAPTIAPNSVTLLDNTKGSTIIETQDKFEGNGGYPKENRKTKEYIPETNITSTTAPFFVESNSLLNTNVADELLKFAQLMEMNLVSREEFNQIKIKLLGGLLQS